VPDHNDHKDREDSANRSGRKSRTDRRDSGRDRGRDQEHSRDDTADPETRARQICLRLLTLAPRTRAQLATALRERGVPGDAADAVLDRFTDVGLIDDAAFARAWVESRHYSRGLAGRALRQELRQRGVDDGQIRDAIDDLGPDAEVATARRLVAQKLASTRGLLPEARIRRLAGTLARKGYPAGLAFRVVREAMEAEGSGSALSEEWEPGEELGYGDPDSCTE
jgi:regulatory protein